MTKSVFALILAAILPLAGCGIIYKVDIAQGIQLDQEDVNQLRPDLTMEQVKKVMGSPAIIDPAHPDRWDYIFYHKDMDNGKIEQKNLVLFFENGHLARMEGNMQPESAEIQDQEGGSN